MTISKKLLLIATFGLGLPFGASANHTTIEINLSNEMTTIANYMPMLRSQTTIGAEKVVQWLDKKLRKQSLNKYDATTIANILESNTTVNTKVANILQIIMAKQTNKAQQANAALSQNRRKVAKTVIETVALCSLGIFCGALILIDAALNPYPRCQACLYGDRFYLDGNPCRYVHTCYRPRKHIHHHHCPSSGVHVHFNV